MLSPLKFTRQAQGFSLVEVLITLSLVGILAAFTIPAVFTTSMSGTNVKHTQSAKNAAYMLLSAYEQYRNANGSVPTTAGISVLTPYLNYVKTDSSSTIDNTSGGSLVCGAANYACLKLHSGSYMYYGNDVSFNGTSTTNGIWIGFDPDGTRNSVRSLGMVLTYGGEVRTYGTVSTTYHYKSGVFTATIDPGASDATWFQGF